MEKPIKFDANMRTGAKPERYPVAWIPVPDDLYEQIPTHFVDGQCESVKRFHVTLSPACPISEEPDYKAMIDDLIYLRERCSNLSRPKLQRVIDFLILEAKHTPQGDQSPGTKKEET